MKPTRIRVFLLLLLLFFGLFVFLSENFQFLDMKFSIYLNMRVFVIKLDSFVN